MFRCHRIRLQETVLALTASAAFLFAGTASFAQVAYDAQIPFSFSSPSLSDPAGVAVAPDGTIYVADIQTSSTANLVRITPNTGTVGGGSGNAANIVATGAKLTPTGVTMKRPTAVVVDSTGALYVADGTAGIVFKIASPESSTTPAATAIPYGGTQKPTALAVDSANNLYIADQTQGAIYRVTGGVATKLTIGAGIKPAGLAVDSAGNVYFADTTTNGIYEYNASTNTAAPFLSSPGGTNFNFSVLPVGMGIDPAGRIYIMDSGNDRIVEATSSNSFTVPFSSINRPGSLVLSSAGNIYLTDDSNNAVVELFYNNNPVNFGSIPAGTASPAITLNYNFITGQAGLDWFQAMEGDNTNAFSQPSAHPCGTRRSNPNVAAGTQCNFTTEVTYQASTPGLRSGTVGLTDNNNDIWGVPTEGIDVAGSLSLYPGTQSVLAQQSGTMLYEPQAVAVSGNGNWLFVADEGGVASGGTYTYPHPAVYAYPVTNGVISSTRSSVGLGFTNPIGLALDAAGNLYVADYSGYIRKIPQGSNNWAGSGTNLSLPAGMLNHPLSLTIDPFGNLYIGDAGPNGPGATAANPGYIVKVPANGGPAIKLNYVVNGTPVIYPEGLTTDSYGNLYIADGGDAANYSNTGGVDVVTASTGAISAISFGAYGYNDNPYSLNLPGSVNFDAAGDLYILDGYNQRVLVMPVNYTGSTPVPDSANVTLLGNGNSGISNLLVTPSSMVVWPGGHNITITDLGYTPTSGPASPSQVITLQAMNSATLDVSRGSASVTGINVGNQVITFDAPSRTGSLNGGANFALVGCGTNGVTVQPGIVNACSATVNYDGIGTQNATFTLNGDASSDYSALGNQITAEAEPNEPVASISAGPLVSSQSGYSVTVTITNLGLQPLILSGIQLTKPSGAFLNGGTCSINQNLIPSAPSCNVVIDLDSVGSFGYNHGALVFTDNNLDVAGSTQTECGYVASIFGVVFGGGIAGDCPFSGRAANSVSSGPINSGLDGITLSAPGSNQPQSGVVNGAVYSQSQTGSASLRPGSGAQPGGAVPQQYGAQPATTIQTGNTPQAAGSYLPLGLVQPNFIAPNDAPASLDDSSIDSDSSTSDQDGTTHKKKKSHKSDSEDSGSASSTSASGGSASHQ